jgi:hypothetical protein
MKASHPTPAGSEWSIFCPLLIIGTRWNGQWAVRDQVTQAVAEALAWLEHAGLVILDPTLPHSTYWRTLSRRGQKLRSREQAAAYREGAILPLSLVHPQILEKSHPAFMRGDHDIAVFSAFKAVTVVLNWPALLKR